MFLELIVAVRGHIRTSVGSGGGLLEGDGSDPLLWVAGGVGDARLTAKLRLTSDGGDGGGDKLSLDSLFFFAGGEARPDSEATESMNCDDSGIINDEKILVSFGLICSKLSALP